ncbi:MAG TPA: exopolysaccharide biosynthesis protein [Thermoleophilaceae bacterium]|nr:exopolysaccharide biosynthesis protein [Thermoleophilaceae bacterium]
MHGVHAAPSGADRPRGSVQQIDPGRPISDQIEDWNSSDGPKTLGSLTDAFEEKAFAVVFVVLLGVPALPLPTGGATHVFELVAMLLALQLIAGRGQVWLPQRWKRLKLDGPSQQKFVRALLRAIRFLERFSRPRATWVFNHRLSNAVFGLLVLLLSIAAFVAPPFSGLDTLPALGAVLISLSVLLEDIVLFWVGVIVGAGGVALEVILGKAAFNGIKSLF